MIHIKVKTKNLDGFKRIQQTKALNCRRRYGHNGTCSAPMKHCQSPLINSKCQWCSIKNSKP